MLDMDKYDMAIELGSAEGGLNLMAFYTYNEKGEKVYGGFQAGSTTKLPTTEIPPGCAATPAGLSVRYPNVAMNPGDTGNDGETLIYNFMKAPWDDDFYAPQSYSGTITKRPEHLCYGKINGESAIYIIKNQGREDCTG